MELFADLEVFYNQPHRHATLWQINPARLNHGLRW
jgi:hypothetical protein